MDLKEIKRLVNLVENAKISHLSIEQDGIKIEVKKELSHNGANMAPVSAVSAIVPQAVAPEAAAEKKEEEDKNLTPLTAQMVGTFYGSPNPDAKPYVKVGDRITKGQTVCIIEAMKLFNEIESDYSGVVEKICTENGAPVEYGQTLFLVRSE